MKNVDPGPSPRILIIRLKPLGDTVLMSPVFRNLKRLYPSSTIDVVIYSMFADAVRYNPHIDTVIELERASLSLPFFLLRCLVRRYDVVIDYINTPLSALIAYAVRARYRIGNDIPRNGLYNLRLNVPDRVYSPVRCLKRLEPLGLDDFSDYMPEFHPGPNDIECAGEFFSGHGLKNTTVGIFVSSKTPSKKYPTSHSIELGTMIAERTGRQVLFLFGYGDSVNYEIVKRATNGMTGITLRKPDTGLGEFAALIARLGFFIANDSGPKHIATAVGIPALTLFGPSTPKMWNPPDDPRYPTVRHDVDCGPCKKNICPTGTMKCMRDLKPERVFEAFADAVQTLGPRDQRRRG